MNSPPPEEGIQAKELLEAEARNAAASMIGIWFRSHRNRRTFNKLKHAVREAVG